MGKRPDCTPDQPMTPDELAALRLQLSRMSPMALLDAYFAAWTRCKMERDGKPPPARFIQELVQAWKKPPENSLLKGVNHRSEMSRQS